MKEGEEVYEEDDFLSHDNENRRLHETKYNKTKNQDNYPDSAFNQLISAQVLIPNKLGDGHIHGTVVWRAVNNMN